MDSVASTEDEIPEVIDAALRRLRGLHLTLSVCRLKSARPGGLAKALATLDDPALMVAPHADGGVAIVYIRPEGQSDREATDILVGKLRRALSAQVEEGLLEEVRLTALHRKADAFGDGSGLFAELEQAPCMRL